MLPLPYLVSDMSLSLPLQEGELSSELTAASCSSIPQTNGSANPTGFSGQMSNVI
jgi:hypothetical protein